MKPRRPSPDSYRSGGKARRSIPVPEVIWQHVFTFVSPLSLGRLLCVNRAFNHCLTGNFGPKSKQVAQGHLKPLEPEAIWIISRNRHYPELPRPLSDLSDLGMWKLLLGRRCQICEASQPHGLGSHMVMEPRSGVSQSRTQVVWPFGIRACSTCLRKITRTVRPYSKKHVKLQC